MAPLGVAKESPHAVSSCRWKATSRGDSPRLERETLVLLLAKMTLDVTSGLNVLDEDAGPGELEKLGI